MKLEKILPTIFLSSSFCILVCSTVSCNYSTKNLIESDFTRSIIKEESIDKVINRLQRTFNSKNNVS